MHPQDLSLLTHLSSVDIAKLQSVGKEAQAERKKFILKDDQERVWQLLKSLEGGRVDFVLDNGKPPKPLSISALCLQFADRLLYSWI
jgi:hypothetical protein